MAKFYTLIVECYEEIHIQNLAKMLESLSLSVDGRDVSLVEINCDKLGKYYYLTARPEGLGYPICGAGANLNEKKCRSEFEAKIYSEISSENGIRRAFCDYEAQDYLYDIEFVDEFDIPNLLYDVKFGSPSSKTKLEKQYLVNL